MAEAEYWRLMSSEVAELPDNYKHKAFLERWAEIGDVKNAARDVGSRLLAWRRGSRGFRNVPHEEGNIEVIPALVTTPRITIRPASPEDWPSITDAFTSKFAHAPQAAKISGEVLASLLEPLLAHWETRVACTDEHPDVIVGFVVFEPKRPDQVNPVIAWVQVLSPWRRRGVGRALLQAAGLVWGQEARTLTPHPEVHSPFTAQRIDRTGPSIARLAEAHGLTFRYRPYLPLEVRFRGTT